MAGKQVAKKGTGKEVATSGWGEYAGSGFEGAGKEDFAIPFIGVLQSNSPLDEISKDARPGMLFNTVTHELWDGEKGVAFVPAARHHCYVEWVPREKGGGFVGIYELDDPVVTKARAEQEFGKKVHPETGNDLVETFYLYGIGVREDKTTFQAMIAFTSTKIKVYKQLMTMAMSIQLQDDKGARFKAPLFSHRYRLTTIKQENNSGKFYNFKVDFDGKSAVEARLSADDPLVQEAVGMHQLAVSGQAKGAYETQAKDGGGADEEVPF